MPAWSNLNGFPPNLTSQIRPVEFSIEITLYACLVESQWISTQFNRSNSPLRLHCMPAWSNLNGFPPNLTSQIQPVEFSIEITLYACLVKSQWISTQFDRSNSPLRLHCMPAWSNLNGFPPNSTSRI